MSWKNKVIAITPFIALIAFVLIGDLTKEWGKAWLVFLLIPAMPFIVGKKQLRFSVTMIIIATYLTIGLTTELWHPYWVILLLIPVYNILITPAQFKFIRRSKDNNIED